VIGRLDLVNWGAISYNGGAKEQTVSEIIHLAWDRFKIVAGIVGDVQGRVIVTLFYFTILVPFGIGARFFGDALHIRSTHPPQWMERPPVQNGLEEARRQG
jgi:hypothetical protein